MTAANTVDLEDRLKVIGLDVLGCRETKQSNGSVFSRVTLKDLIVFCIHLEQLERAGVPILEAIADLRDTADSQQLKNIMSDVYEAIKSGSLLSEALDKHPKIFNNVFVSLVAAGEKSGNLHEIFFHLAKHLKWVNHIQSKTKKAIYYPTFLLTLMGAIVGLMMLFVIPKLKGFLLANDIELPIYTIALINTSEFFVNYWYYLIIVPIALIITIKVLCKLSEGIAYRFDILKLNLPVIGKIIRKIELARFCHFFAIMYRSGIGILECLEIASDVVNNRMMKESTLLVRRSVSEGTSLTNSLRITNQFPNLVIRMFKVGEESGNLDTTLENINFFYDREVEDGVNALVGMIQPTLTLVMGGVMAWVMMSVFGPLYSNFSNMNF